MSLDKLKPKSRNIPLMFAMEVIGGMLFFLPVLALYLEESLFTLTNVALIFSIEAIAIVLLEMPTGALADLFGRKRTIVLAQAAVLLAVVFLAIGQNMAFFVLFALFNALGRSLTSGTYSAFLYDTLKEEGKEEQFKKYIGRLFALWPLGASLGAVIGGYLASISYTYAVVVTVIPITIALVMSLFLKEPVYEKADHRNVGRQIWNSFQFIMERKSLILLFVAGFVSYGIGEPLHMLESVYLNYNNIPVEYYGYITAAVFACSSVGQFFSAAISEKIGDKWLLILATIMAPLLLITSSYGSGVLLVFLWVFQSLSFGLRNPVISHVINASVDSSKRATVLSVSNFVNQIGIAIVAPLVGLVAQVSNINLAVRWWGTVLLVVPLLYLFLKPERVTNIKG